MPKFSKLSPEEVERLARRPRPRVDLSEYMAFLDQFKPGEWGSIVPEEGEKPRVIKRRLTAAANAKGMKLKYRRSAEGRIIFRVE